jgi:sarcosine oxidase subunit beta
VIDRRENVTLCTMSGVGFGLSPASGHAVSDLVLEGKCSFTDIEKLGLSRFDGIEANWQTSKGWLPL